jgi:hypothetical protein
MPQSGPLMAIHACLPCRPGTYPSLRRWDLSSQELRSTPLPGWHIDRCNGGNGIDTAVNCGECRSELWPWRHRAMKPGVGLEPTTPSLPWRFGLHGAARRCLLLHANPCPTSHSRTATAGSYWAAQRTVVFPRCSRADIRASSPSFRQINMAACLPADREPAWEFVCRHHGLQRVGI